MTDFMELSNVMAPDVWGVWEPLAFFLLTAGASATIMAALAALLRGNADAARRLGGISLAAGATGQTCLLLGLEQPLRAYELFTRPHFVSWTAWGGFLIPCYLLCTLALVVRARKGGTPFRLLSVPALVAGAFIFVYASGEIRDCIGRALWLTPLLPVAFVASGAVAACGMAGLTSSVSGGWRWAGALGACACAALAAAFTPPQGFAAFATIWWHVPETVAAVAALAALLGAWLKWPRLTGAMACLSAFMVFWKIIHMGQAFQRNASTFSDAAAFQGLFSPTSLLSLAGGIGLCVALNAILSVFFPLKGERGLF